MQRNINITCFMLLFATACVANAQEPVPSTLRYVDTKQANHDAQVIDTRALASCQKRSIAGAHCLPAHDLVGPQGQLPSFVDIFWALGTAGISPHKPVLIVGNQPRARDFVAGLLFLCGQSSIQVLDTPIEMVLQQKQWPAAQGQARGILRHTVYAATMRDELIVLPEELSHALATHDTVVAIDGRNATTQNSDEYTAGHIPGAIQLPPAQVNPLSRYLRPTSDKRIATHPLPAQTAPGYFVVYAHSAMDSIAYFARLRANEVNPQVDIRVLPAGWQGWIKHLEYPVSHSVVPQQSQLAGEDKHNFQNSIYPIAAIAVSGSAMLIIFIGLRKRGEKQWS